MTRHWLRAKFLLLASRGTQKERVVPASHETGDAVAECTFKREVFLFVFSYQV